MFRELGSENHAVAWWLGSSGSAQPARVRLPEGANNGCFLTLALCAIFSCERCLRVVLQCAHCRKGFVLVVLGSLWLV